MSRFLRKEYESMEPYTPGEQPKMKDLLKLNTNENPYSPSPKVIEAITSEEILDLVRYPDPEARELVDAIAEYCGAGPENVAVGNGSDEILAFVYMAFGEKIYFPAVSYGFYPVFAETFRCEYEAVPLTEGLAIDPDDYMDLDGTIVIANPNAPTGMTISTEDIRRIAGADPGRLVVIDEAYTDFGNESCVPLTGEYDNLLVVQTLSKSRSLAGMRIGMAIGNSEIIADINKMKFSFNPYNLDRIAIKAGVAALKDDAYFRECRDKVMRTRERFTDAMRGIGFEVLPSKANFVFVRSDRISGREYFEKLRERSIVVRYFDRDPIRDYVRITIGRDGDMDRLVRATEEILCEKA